MTNALIVRDSLGRALELEPESLGRGGQGAVHRVVGSSLAVKLVRQPRSGAQDADPGIADRLRVIQRLPLDGLPLAHPVALLMAPDVGYVMELLEGVVPLRQILDPTGQADVAGWYLETGGLRRRLRLLSYVAWVLATLHGRGIVYGDPSPDNILVSQRVDRDPVWFVDIDNLAVEADASRRLAGPPGYGAPELRLSASRLSTLSDAFAFAVLAFQALVANHPFVGDGLLDETPEHVDEVLKRFSVPWIDHKSDDANCSSFGIDRGWVVRPAVRRLFVRTFEAGLHAPAHRPAMSTWLDELLRAADQSRACTCGHSCYVDAPTCPWCGSGLSPVVIARAWIHTPAWDFTAPESEGEGSDSASGEGATSAPRRTAILPTRDALVLEPGHNVDITSRIGLVADHGDPHRPIATARWDGADRLGLRNVGGRPFTLVSPDGRNRRRVKPAGDTVVHIQAGAPAWRLHFARHLDSTHRVVTFDVLAWR